MKQLRIVTIFVCSLLIASCVSNKVYEVPKYTNLQYHDIEDARKLEDKAYDGGCIETRLGDTNFDNDRILSFSNRLYDLYGSKIEGSKIRVTRFDTFIYSPTTCRNAGSASMYTVSFAVGALIDSTANSKLQDGVFCIIEGTVDEKEFTGSAMIQDREGVMYLHGGANSTRKLMPSMTKAIDECIERASFDIVSKIMN